MVTMRHAIGARCPNRRPTRAPTARRDVAACASGGEAGARVAVLGASGYTGSEIVRLLALHPNISVGAITSERSAGKPFHTVFPHLRDGFFGHDAQHVFNMDLQKVEDVDWDGVDVVFCCLPHGTTQDIIAALPRSKKVVDLSADFRLRDVHEYAKWYGGEHKAPALQEDFVYGLTECKRSEIASAQLVANPGCYPTSIQIPLVPLLAAGLILPDDIIIDAKSGVSGAGRGAKQSNLYVEIAEGMNAYGITSHRHVPEIEQGLSEALPDGGDVKISFTPHLIAMSRGMQATIYAKLGAGCTADDVRRSLEDAYARERFVHIMKAGEIPHTRFVRGSNHCMVGVFEDRIPGRVILVSVIDNLVKGASGQAIQNMNLMLGLDETTGLMQIPMFP